MAALIDIDQNESDLFFKTITLEITVFFFVFFSLGHNVFFPSVGSQAKVLHSKWIVCVAVSKCYIVVAIHFLNWVLMQSGSVDFAGAPNSAVKGWRQDAPGQVDKF